jgi:hypothetical protein
MPFASEAAYTQSEPTNSRRRKTERTLEEGSEDERRTRRRLD